MDSLDVYIGYDPREDDAYQVCRFSMSRHASVPLQITALRLSPLQNAGLYTRRTKVLGNGIVVDALDNKPFSTEFSFSRFLVPELMHFHGWALFCDCDILWRGDVAQMMSYMDPKYAVLVVKHLHRPTVTTKMDGVPQTRYFRKNWSSVVLWNCGHPANRTLNHDAVNSREGSWLHAFEWLPDHLIGELPPKFNYLVGYTDIDEEPVGVHFTDGGPWFENYKNVEYGTDWMRELYHVRSGRHIA